MLQIWTLAGPVHLLSLFLYPSLSNFLSLYLSVFLFFLYLSFLFLFSLSLLD